jgi:hypothetical protein
VTKTTCDRCGKELSPGEGAWLGASLRTPSDRSKLDGTRAFIYDVCSGCMADLSRFMKELEEE